MTSSLENQRRALLEKMEARRAVYQRMLRGDNHNGTFKSQRSRPNTHSPSPLDSGLQWVRSHPLLSTVGVALLVALLPRAISTKRHKQYPSHATERPAFARAIPMVKAAALLLLNDPTRMRMAGYLTRSVWHWLNHRLNPTRH